MEQIYYKVLLIQHPYFKDGELIYCGDTDGFKVYQNIIKEIKDWENNSRAIVCISWNFNESHAFIAENVDGRIVFLDPQNASAPVDLYLYESDSYKTKIMRIDNLEISDKIKYCCEQR